MVYLGGIASIGGSILGATALHAAARDPAAVDRGGIAVMAAAPALFDPLDKYVISHLGVLRMIIMPLLLVLVMIFWPRGIMGKREFRMFVPRRDREAHRPEPSVGGMSNHGVADSP